MSFRRRPLLASAVRFSACERAWRAWRLRANWLASSLSSGGGSSAGFERGESGDRLLSDLDLPGGGGGNLVEGGWPGNLVEAVAGGGADFVGVARVRLLGRGRGWRDRGGCARRCRRAAPGLVFPGAGRQGDGGGQRDDGRQVPRGDRASGAAARVRRQGGAGGERSAARGGGVVSASTDTRPVVADAFCEVVIRVRDHGPPPARIAGGEPVESWRRFEADVPSYPLVSERGATPWEAVFRLVAMHRAVLERRWSRGGGNGVR